MQRLALFILISATAARASAFEGVLHMTTTIAQVPPIPSDVSMRENGDTRTDSIVPGTGESMSIIQKSNGKTVTTITLMHAKKTYVETTAPADASAPANAADILKNLEVKQLGSETVAGFACKHAQLIQGSGTTIDVWVSNALGIDMTKTRNPQGVASEMLKVLEKNDLKGFPLKMKATHQGQSLVVETTKVEKKTIDAGAFEAPKEYTKADKP